MYVLFIFYVMTIIALFVLRRKYPDAPRPFKVPGYPYTPVIFIVIASVYILSVFIFQFPTDPNTWYGMVVLAIGLPVYWIWFRENGTDSASDAAAGRGK